MGGRRIVGTITPAEPVLHSAGVTRIRRVGTGEAWLVGGLLQVPGTRGGGLATERRARDELIAREPGGDLAVRERRVRNVAGGLVGGGVRLEVHPRARERPDRPRVLGLRVARDLLAVGDAHDELE